MNLMKIRRCWIGGRTFKALNYLIESVDAFLLSPLFCQGIICVIFQIISIPASKCHHFPFRFQMYF